MRPSWATQVVLGQPECLKKQNKTKPNTSDSKAVKNWGSHSVSYESQSLSQSPCFACLPQSLSFCTCLMMPELPGLRCAWSWEENSGGESLRSIFNWTLKDTFPEFSCWDLYVLISLLFTSVYLWQEVDLMSMPDAVPTANHEMTKMVWGKSESCLPTEDSLPSHSSRNHTCYLNKVFV